MPRQKNVFTDNREIAHKWFHAAQDSARNPQGNFYFTGSTIYSYGSHFPIATIVTPTKGKGKGQKTVLFTTRNYSPTTQGHKADVRSAIRSYDRTADDGHGGLGRWVEAGAKIFGVSIPTQSEERIQGDWDSRIKNAQELADDIGVIGKDAKWPLNHID